MVARGPGAVGCAHCTRLGAEVACDVCGHLVCPACAADWSTCNLPSGKVVRLGLTSRLIDVDVAGRYGIVGRWSATLRCVDLRALSWVEAKLPYATPHDLPPRLTPAGEVVVREYGPTSQGGFFEGMAFTPMFGGLPGLVGSVDYPARLTSMTPRGDVFWYVGQSETVTAITLETRVVSVFDPLPRKVIQAAFFDSAQSVLASGTWGQVVVHDVVNGKLSLRSGVTTIGDTRWIAVAGPWLAIADQHEVTVRRLDGGEVVLRLGGRHPCGALSRDGRYLAVGDSHADVVVQDLEARTSQRFEEHSDAVSFVRFADDHLLITADDDNRVILRPRGAEGYARALMAAELR